MRGLTGSSAGRRRRPARYLRHRGCCLVTALALLAGCSAPWKAPVESRSSSAYRDAQISGDSYRVRPGDTLYGIAWRAGADYKDLAAWNNIPAPYTIFVGQRLRLTAAGTATAKQQAKATSSAATASRQPAAGGSASKTRVSASDSSGAKAADQGKLSGAKGPSASRDLSWRWPTEGRLAGTYSPQDPSRKGIKISGARGQPVRAAEAGEVVYSGSGLVGYGELIILKHANDYLSAYGHNARRLVREGERVERGATIAEMGMAGGKPQLHFEIRRSGKPVDPLALLPRR